MIKCKNCGGNLKYDNSVFICESCKTKYNIHDYFEAYDVYLCYVENDDTGRRSKDSIIAQEINSVLNENKIETFYPRNANDDFVGNQYNTICHCALSCAKIIIIIGTNKSNFELIFNEYKDLIKLKTVIPVFTDIDVLEIPKDISTIQAINYNKIGIKIDLVRSVLNLLGREKEIELSEITKKSKSKKRIITITLVLIFLITIIAGTSHLVFGTTLVLPIKKYEYAMICMENNKNIEAIKYFNKILDYKDSKAQIQNIYNSYAGYYYDKDSDISVQLTIYDGNNANLQLEKVTDNGEKIKINETAQVEFDSISYNFQDSEGNNGTVDIVLSDNAFTLRLKTENKGKIYIPDYENTFSVKDKSDAPFSKEITKEYLLNIINNNTTLQDLKRDGFDVSFVSNMPAETDEYIYKIDDTDILLEVHSYDASIYGHYTDHSDVKKLAEPIIFAVNAPAEYIIPSRIGEINKPFINDNIIYVPDADFDLGFKIDYGIDFKNDNIKSNTPVSIVSKSKLTVDDFEEYVSDFNDYYISIAECAYYNKYCNEKIYPYADIAAENETEFLIGVKTGDDNLPLVYYRVNKENGSVEYIKEFSKDEIISVMPEDDWTSDELVDYCWTFYIEYFEDFIN